MHLVCSGEIWYMDHSFFSFRTFLSLSRRNCRADTVPGSRRKKPRIRREWVSFPWRLSCGFGGISYVVGFNDLLLFFWILCKNEKLRFLRTDASYAASIDSLADCRKILGPVAVSCLSFYYWCRTKTPLNPMTFLQVDLWTRNLYVAQTRRDYRELLRSEKCTRCKKII